MHTKYLKNEFHIFETVSMKVKFDKKYSMKTKEGKAQYELYTLPVPSKYTRSSRVHPRLVESRTVGTDEVATKIQRRSTLTVADVKGALSALSEVMVETLQEGNRVYLKGMGYFSLSLTCPATHSQNQIRAESITVKNIDFRPEAQLKKQLKKIQLERVHTHTATAELTLEERSKLLVAWFAEHASINRREYERVCQCTRTTAYRQLKELVLKGNLLREGSSNAPVYLPSKVE